MIVAAGDHADVRSGRALERICSGYWRPIYLYVRGRGYSPEQAEDLTQGFFERLIEKNQLADFRKERGRFRSFLLAAVKHYLANQHDRAKAVKRGGDQNRLVIDWSQGDPERTFSLEPADSTTPEALFAREWGRTVIDRTRERLRAEMERAGKKTQFHELIANATGDEDIPYRRLASLLGMTEGRSGCPFTVCVAASENCWRTKLAKLCCLPKNSAMNCDFSFQLSRGTNHCGRRSE